MPPFTMFSMYDIGAKQVHTMNNQEKQQTKPLHPGQDTGVAILHPSWPKECDEQAFGAGWMHVFIWTLRGPHKSMVE